jgi:hypothetical protein
MVERLLCAALFSQINWAFKTPHLPLNSGPTETILFTACWYIGIEVGMRMLSAEFNVTGRRVLAWQILSLLVVLTAFFTCTLLTECGFCHQFTFVAMKTNSLC